MYFCSVPFGGLVWFLYTSKWKLQREREGEREKANEVRNGPSQRFEQREMLMNVVFLVGFLYRARN